MSKTNTWISIPIGKKEFFSPEQVQQILQYIYEAKEPVDIEVIIKPEGQYIISGGPCVAA